MARFFGGLPSAAWRADIVLDNFKADARSSMSQVGVSGAPLPRAAAVPQGGAVAQVAPSSSTSSTLPSSSTRSVATLLGGLKLVSASDLTQVVGEKLKQDEIIIQVRAARLALGIPWDIADITGVVAKVQEALDADVEQEEAQSASSSEVSVDEHMVGVKRRKLPKRRPYTRGSAADLDDVELDAFILEELSEEKFAGTGLITLNLRIQWWRARTAARNLQPWPLTPPLVALAAALLRRGGYRSAPAYLSAMRREHIRLGYEWSDALDLEQRDCIRAVLRGIGPAKQAAPFDLKAIGAVQAQAVLGLSAPGFPELAKEAIIFASWWLLREIELAATTLAQITITMPDESELDHQDQRGCAEVNLPASKADTQALGKRRSLRCSCPSPLCPVAAAKRLVAAARVRQVATGGSAEFVPLVVDINGAPVTKAGMVKAFKRVAELSGMKDVSRITGHSARVTGAQRMALAGISEWRIQVFGRWGSAAVLKYVRDTIVDADAHHISAEVVLIDDKPLNALHRDMAIKPARSVQQLAAEAVAQQTSGESEAAISAAFRDQCQRFTQRLKDVEGRAVPAVVACRRSSRAHRVANMYTTLCGWTWSADPRSIAQAGVEWEGSWCKVCVKAFDRLRGEA